MAEELLRDRFTDLMAKFTAYFGKHLPDDVMKSLTEMRAEQTTDIANTIYDAIQQGGSFESGLRTRTFEDDGPNWTPRISGIVNAHSGAYKLSILKSADGNGDSVQRYFFEYGQPVAGEGHFISTYKCNGSPIPSFEGEPLRVAMPDSVTAFAQMLWASLNEDNKVSLFVRCIDLESGRAGDILYNKYSEVE